MFSDIRVYINNFDCIIVCLEDPSVKSNESTKHKNPEEKDLEECKKIESEYIEKPDYKEEVKEQIVDDLKIFVKKEPENIAGRCILYILT